MSYQITIETTLERALEHHRAGYLPEAQVLYEQILYLAPSHSDALHLLGLIAHQRGDNEGALYMIESAITSNPAIADFYNSLGVVCGELEKYPEAVASFQHAIALKPDFASAIYNLGNIWQQCGDLGQAIACFQQALELNDDFIDARTNLGNVYQTLGRLDEAAACFREALRRNPVDTDAGFNLANTLKQQGKLDEAVLFFKYVLEQDPLRINAYNNLANILQDQNRFSDAISIYKHALCLDSGRADIFNNLGNAYRAQNWLEEASAAYRQVLLINPNFAEALNNLGNVLKDQARMSEALACYEKALDLNPRLADVYSNLLLTAQYMTTYSSAQLYALHLGFAERFEQPLRAFWPRYDNSNDPNRRLKIGYVSADFRDHAVANFMEPVIEHHDRNQVEVFCYYNNVKQDSFTIRLMAAADHWLPCQGMSDEQLASRIRADGIDILIDLSGHSAGGRLLVFARKPAPVQLSYLGYIATTGLSAIDYRLTQIDVDPPGNEKFYSETLFRLSGDLWWCYRPSASMPEPTILPAIANGFVTFGATNNLGKLTSEVIALWSEILLAIPSAQLLIAGVSSGFAQQELIERFTACGIGAERLRLHGRMPVHQFQELHAQIDIALDPFPYNGGTTSCDALWLGLPFVSMIGQSFVSRMGYALLKSIGLPELAAENSREYLAIACRLADDLPSLAKLRAGMRARIACSSLCDEVGFTRKLEMAYRTMWQTWCSQQPPSTGNSLINVTANKTIKQFLHVGYGPQCKANTTRAFNTSEWIELRLDIDQSVESDIIGTIIDMSAVADASVDAVFSSHYIEHLYVHEVPLALAEFKRVLRPEGYAVITCPDLQSVCALVAEDKLTEPAYTSSAGSITPLDILYGHRSPMAKGNLYMAHRCGFTQKVLIGTLEACGFVSLATLRRVNRLDLWAVASVSLMEEAVLREIAESHFPQ